MLRAQRIQQVLLQQGPHGQAACSLRGIVKFEHLRCDAGTDATWMAEASYALRTRTNCNGVCAIPFLWPLLHSYPIKRAAQCSPTKKASRRWLIG